MKLTQDKTNPPGLAALKIEIPSILENLRVVESFIDNAKDQFSITDEIYGNIMISITETVNNAIVHGNHQDINKLVKISLRAENQCLIFLVTDEGEGFDFKNLQDPTAPENIENETGRGIFLMKHLCDEVNFLGSGNQIELVFYFNE